jgi:hypothetical protein
LGFVVFEVVHGVVPDVENRSSPVRRIVRTKVRGKTRNVTSVGAKRLVLSVEAHPCTSLHVGELRSLEKD